MCDMLINTVNDDITANNEKYGITFCAKNRANVRNAASNAEAWHDYDPCAMLTFPNLILKCITEPGW